jgi:hypothetical protein
MKIIIGIAFLGILISLGSAGLFMLRRPDPEKPKNKSMVNALTLRIGLSVALFLMILLLWAFGYIEPTGIIPGQQ